MLDRVRQFIADEGLVHGKQAMWVAVSGGVDSMVLLHVLDRLGSECQVAHVDHGLRGAESDADLALVRDYCAELRIPFRAHEADVKKLAESPGVSVQMAARELRRNWFNELVSEGPAVIALAHHRDDAVETLLIQLMRGMGSQGWAGIAPRSGGIIRPLLCVDRETIHAYAVQNDVPYREDTSNADPKYLRNRVRNELLPLMGSLRPGALRVMGRDAMLFRDLVKAAGDHMDDLLRKVPIAPDGSLRIPFTVVLGSGTPELMLHHILRSKGFHPDRIADVLSAVRRKATGSYFEEGTTRVFVDREELVVTSASVARSWTIGGPDELHADVPIGISFLGTAEMVPDPRNRIVWLDADRTEFPLELRPWQAGDRMQPLGSGGSKLVSDVLIDAKVPRDRKETTMVLKSGDHIVWLCGHCIDHRYRIQADTAKALRIEWTGE